MTACLAIDHRARRHVLADEAYCRLRHLLANAPSMFFAVRDGLGIEAAALDAHVLRVGHDDALPRAATIAAATEDQWLLRAARSHWLLHPEAFDCTEDLPAGVVDRRWDGVVTAGGLRGRADDEGYDHEQDPALATCHSLGSRQPAFDDGWQ